MSRPTIQSVQFRMATEHDAGLPAYDNTALEAYNTCNTYGTIRYGMHLRPQTYGRAMALEAGSAMHEVFMWVRLCTLCLSDAPGELIDYHMARLFGDRAELIWEQATSTDHVLHCKEGAVAVLETSGFYDDPRDKKRTLANLEECAFAYIDKWDWSKPVWVRDPSDPCSDVGIEIPFDLVVTTTHTRVESIDTAIADYKRMRAQFTNVPMSETEEGVIREHLERDTVSTQRRFIGKIDGIHVHGALEGFGGVPMLHENKTASRLNDAWSMSFRLRSQVTGYCVAASVFTEQPVRDAMIHGLSIPLPRSYDMGGVITEHVTRQDFHINDWIAWFVATAEGFERDKDSPYDALRFTHSCSRYFSPCVFVPWCDSERDEQEVMLSEMVTDEWSPLDKKETE